jgi:CBS domain-containing protein
VPIVDVMNLRLVRVSPQDSVQTAIGRMLEENVGSVAVCEGPRIVGIFTERDVLRLAGRRARFDEVPIADVMTTRLVSVSPDDEILAAARLMGEHRVRHLPLIEDGNLLGIVGIRDVLAALVEQVWRTQDAQARETVRQLLGRMTQSGQASSR